MDITKYNRLEFIVNEIESEFKDDVRRKICRLLNDLGLTVIMSNVGVIKDD